MIPFLCPYQPVGPVETMRVTVRWAQRTPDGIVARVDTTDPEQTPATVPVRVRIPNVACIPQRYRASALRAVSTLENWIDSDQTPLSEGRLWFRPALSHATITVAWNTLGDALLTWIRRTP